MLRRIYALNFMDAFIAGIVAIAVPVMMLERGISVESIGLVFALVPIVKMLVRLASSAMADRAGERLFYFLNAAGNFAQAACYAIASTLGFALGKLFDGARESFIFSVNRTSIISFAPHKRHHGPAQLISGRLMANAAGSLAVFFLAPAGGYGLLLLLIAALSAAMLFLSNGVANTHAGKEKQPGIAEIVSAKRERRFWETTAAMTVGGSLYTVMFYIAMPIYMKLSGMTLHEIGLLYAVYLLSMGIVMGLLSRHDISANATAGLGLAIFTVSLGGIAFGGIALLPYFFLLMSIGDSCLAFLWERIIYLTAKESRSKSTDIALMHTPAGVVVIFTSAAFGFFVASFGFAALFIATLATFFIYGAWCVRLSCMKD